MDNLIFLDLGETSYENLLKFQERVLKIKKNTDKDFVILCQPFKVITLGRRFSFESSLIRSKEILEDIKIISTDRGGGITYHDEGQILVYIILDLRRYKRDINWYISFLEEMGIKFLSHFGIKGEVGTRRGLWHKDKKIISIGIGIRHWLTYHGMAINVKTDLNYFNKIKPCSLDIEATSMEYILKKDINLKKAKEILIDIIEDSLSKYQISRASNLKFSTV